ncbi:MAG: hypothetical protein KAR06_00705 [Deltaproteobacteria bacterium]|nr:hypothetical protein [Deltaproteobacteria bacterium]
MTNTTRQDILADIKSTLNGISVIKQVSVGKVSAVDIEKVAFPVCFVFSEDETKAEPKSDLVETWIWHIGLEIWSKNSDMETMMGLIQTAMNEDRTCGGNAIFCERISSDRYMIDPSKFIMGLSMTYEIKYRHAVLVP